MIKINGVVFDGNKFPNGETIFEVTYDMLHGDSIFIVELIWESNDDIFNLIILKKYLDELSSVYATKVEDARIRRRIILRCPFMPYGQADRQISIDNGNSYLCTFKYFAQIINDLEFDCVEILDPHSPVMAATLKNCLVCYPVAGWICGSEKKYDTYFFPDNGACKKYTEVFEDYLPEDLQKPYTFAYKKRNLETGEILGLQVVDPEIIEGRDVLITDDLIIRGGTYKYAAAKLKELGAKSIDLYITHLMPTAEDFYKSHKEFGIDNFYSANTLQLPWYQQ